MLSSRMLINKTIARSGCMNYSSTELMLPSPSDDIIPICRDLTELKDLASKVAGIPITIGHYRDSIDEVEIIGEVIGGMAQDGLLEATLFIQDGFILDNVGFSLDYISRLVISDKGELMSTDAVVDSLAIVDNPRCGRVCMV